MKVESNSHFLCRISSFPARTKHHSFTHRHKNPPPESEAFGVQRCAGRCWVYVAGFQFVWFFSRARRRTGRGHVLHLKHGRRGSRRAPPAAAEPLPFFTRSRRAEPRCPRAHRPEEERSREERSRAGCSAPLRAGRAPAPALPRAAQRRALRLLTVLLLGAGEGELAAEVGLGDGPLPPAGQGRCQQEQPEEEHWAGGARGSGTAGTGGAAPRPGRLSAAPGAGCAAGEKAALSLLWQRRIAG